MSKINNCDCPKDNPGKMIRRFRRIPKEMKFHFLPEFGICPPGKIIASEVRLCGFVIFSFEPTEKEEVYTVRARDVQLRCYPFILPVDIDNDGLLEHIEIQDLAVGSEIFDLEACTGLVNIETNYFEIEWHIKLTPENLPVLRSMEEKIIEVVVPDSGYLDFRKGKFEIHRGVFKIEKGPIANYLIRGSATGTYNGPPPPDIELNVAIVTPGSYGCGDTKRDGVTICEGDQIYLCWKSSGTVDSVNISPGAYKNLKESDILVIKPKQPAGSNSITYTAETFAANSDFDPATDSIRVDFYEGRRLDFQALPDKLNKCWRINIPAEAYSSKIIAKEITISTGVGCFDWKDLYIKYESPPYPIGPSQTQSLGFDIHDYGPHQITGERTVVGTYLFYPTLNKEGKGIDINDVNQPLCFLIKGACSKI